MVKLSSENRAQGTNEDSSCDILIIILKTSTNMETWRIAVIICYSSLAVAFIGVLGYSCYYQPLFPFDLDSLEWCKLWLGTTVGDYYLVVASLSAIVIATENWILGIMWVLGMCLLGSPVACLYIAFKVLKGSNLKIRDSHSIA